MLLGDIIAMMQSTISALTTPPDAVDACVFDATAFDPLISQPTKTLRGNLQGVSYAARIAIPNYDAAITRHFATIALNGLATASKLSNIPFALSGFGLIIAFEQRAEVAVHDADMVLDESIRALVAQFGAVMFRNACIAGPGRLKFHRNIFPHLKFHVDRGANAANQYSCFTRDPNDPAQQSPRASSTLFIANIVAWLEAVRSGDADPREERGVRASYNLFDGAKAAKLFGKIVLEQPWDEPKGSGEIAVIDNRTVLHATYDKKKHARGYPIGNRYLI